MNYKKIFKRETKVIAYVVICMTILVIGTSYALFFQVDNNTNNQVVEAGSLEVTYSAGNTITVDETDKSNCLMPQSDANGSGSGGCSYTLSVSNKGTLPMEYNLLIYDNASGVPTGASLVDHSLIRHSLKKRYTVAGTSETVTSASSIDSLDSYNGNKKILDTSVIDPGETITFSLKIWIDSRASADIIGQYVNLKLDVEGSVPKIKLCKRATTLHTETCNGFSHMPYGCSSSSETFTFGNLGTRGTLTVGDAFDCDVNGDGEYNAETERFYYVSDYYDTGTDSFDSNYATLIYYNTVKDGEPNKIYHTIAYDANGYTNDFGPETAKTFLPTTSQWINVNLKSTNRYLPYYLNSSTGKDFSYEGYAARLLTYQEVYDGCYNGTELYNDDSLIDKCEFLLEKTSYVNGYEPGIYASAQGFWLESPCDTSDYYVYTVEADGSVDSSTRNYTASVGTWNGVSYGYGVKPVIDVAKENIAY